MFSLRMSPQAQASIMPRMVFTLLLALAPVGGSLAQDIPTEQDGRLLVYGGVFDPPASLDYARITAQQAAFVARLQHPVLNQVLASDLDALTAIDLLPREEILALIATVLPAPDAGTSLLLQQTQLVGPHLTMGTFLDPFQSKRLAAAVRERVAGASAGTDPALPVRLFCQLNLRAYDFQAQGFALERNVDHHCLQDILANARSPFPMEIVVDLAEFPDFIPMSEANAEALHAELGQSPSPFLVLDAIATSSVTSDQMGRSRIRVTVSGGPPYRLHDPRAPESELFRLPHEADPVFDLSRPDDLASLLASAKGIDPANTASESLFDGPARGILRMRWTGQVSDRDAETVHPVPYLGPTTEALGGLIGVPGSHLVGGGLVLPDPTVTETWLVLPAPFDAWRAPRPASGAARDAASLLVTFEIGKTWLFGPENQRTLLIAARPRTASVVAEESNTPLSPLEFSPVVATLEHVFTGAPAPKMAEVAEAAEPIPAEILEIHLGMDMAQAEDLLRGRMTLGWTAKLPPKTTPLPFQDFALFVAADGHEQIALIPDQADPARVAGIARVLLTEPGITPEIAAQSLREKYGVPRFEPPWGLVWTAHPGAREDSPETTQAWDYGARCYADLYQTYDLLSLKTREEQPGLNPFLPTQAPQIYVGGHLGNNPGVTRMATAGYFDTCGPTVIAKIEPMDERTLLLYALIDLRAYTAGSVPPPASAAKLPDL